MPHNQLYLDWESIAHADSLLDRGCNIPDTAQGEMVQLLRGMRKDLADLRMDIVGNRGSPNGPLWGGNFDERLWALTKSTSWIAYIVFFQALQLLVAIVILYRVW